MDREKAFIPGDQIQFIDHIVLPVYRMLRDLDTSTEVVHRAVVKNKNYWVAMKNILEERGVRREKMDVMEIFQVTKSSPPLIILYKVVFQDSQLECDVTDRVKNCDNQTANKA